MSVARPALLPLIFIEKVIARFGYVRAMTFDLEKIYSTANRVFSLWLLLLFPALVYYFSAIKFDVHIFIWLFTVRTPQVFLLAGEAGGIKTASAIIAL